MPVKGMPKGKAMSKSTRTAGPKMKSGMKQMSQTPTAKKAMGSGPMGKPKGMNAGLSKLAGKGSKKK